MLKSTYLYIAKFFTIAGLIIMSVASLLVIVLAIGSFASTEKTNQNLVTLEIPLKLESDFHIENVAFNDNPFLAKKIEYDNVGLEVYPTNNIPLSQCLIYLTALIYILILLSIFYQLFKILEDFTKPFRPKNINRIKKIGFLVIGIEVYRLTIALLIYIIIGSEIQLENAEVIPFNIMNIDFPIIFLGILILTLSEVFKQGNILQEYENQTI